MRQFGFRDIRPTANSFDLLHSRTEVVGELEQWTHRRIDDLNVEDIDIMLSSEFHAELRIVRRMLTGSKPGMETTDASRVVASEGI